MKDHAGGDAWQTITVLFNGQRQPATVPVPAGNYKVVATRPGNQAKRLGHAERRCGRRGGAGLFGAGAGAVRRGLFCLVPKVYYHH
ncbi:MAG: hypothetical protein WKG07_37795 [Hymenobacter sp.]